MDKNESLRIKGIAILFMLSYHLFDNISTVKSECIIYLTINGLPLINVIQRLTNPVSIFLVLSGYGLFRIWQKKRQDVHRFSRILKLFLSYWIILLVFVPIAAYMRPDVYPGSIVNVILNLLTLSNSYSNVYWFLFPYIVLSLLFPYIYLFVDRFNKWLVFIPCFLLNLFTSYMISRHGAEYLFNNDWLYKPFLCFHLLFPMVLGALCAKYDTLQKNKRIQKSSMPMMCVLLIFRCCFQTSAFHVFYVIAFIALFINLKVRTKIVDSFFETMGKYSMEIWMIHPWFCYHLWHGQTYSFKYPILIFIFLLSVSFFLSVGLRKILIEPIFLFLDKRINW